MAENRAADQPQVDDEDRSDVDQEAHIQVRGSKAFARPHRFTRLPLKSCLKEAEELKLEGNEYFREKRWEEALNAYRTGLGRLPKRKESLRQNELRNDKGKGKGREDDTSTEEARDAAEETGTSQDGPVEAEAAKVPLTGLEAECSKARSIINANIGACYVKLVSGRSLRVLAWQSSIRYSGRPQGGRRSVHTRSVSVLLSSVDTY